MIKERRLNKRLAIWLCIQLGAMPVLLSANAIPPEKVAIIPKLGELGAPDDAFLPRLERLPEHRFADPWAEFGEDWLLTPRLAAAWALNKTHRRIVPSTILLHPSEVQTIVYGKMVTLEAVSSHVVEIPGRSHWRDLLASPFMVGPTGQKESLSSSYDLVHWIHKQHAFLSGKAPTNGPKGILVSVYGSRHEAMDALVIGDIDALDDLLPEERRRIHGAHAEVELFNRRSNRLLYLLWNPDCSVLEQPETRSRLELLMDKRRIASRAGSRAAWATSCPVPTPVPGAWSSGSRGAYSHGERAALPESLVLWSEDAAAAVAAGIEVARDMERHGISVRRFVASDGTDPRSVPSLDWSAWVGSYTVSPASLLPSVPPGCRDVLAPCRRQASLNEIPSDAAWRDLASRLRGSLESERTVTFLCWLPRWGAVSKRWLIPAPGARSLLNDVVDWTVVPHVTRAGR